MPPQTSESSYAHSWGAGAVLAVVVGLTYGECITGEMGMQALSDNCLTRGSKWSTLYKVARIWLRLITRASQGA